MEIVQEIIQILSLKPHPEGGYFRETFRDVRLIDGRAASTAIYYLLPKAKRSHCTASMRRKFGTGMAGRRWLFPYGFLKKRICFA